LAIDNTRTCVRVRPGLFSIIITVQKRLNESELSGQTFRIRILSASSGIKKVQLVNEFPARRVGSLKTNTTQTTFPSKQLPAPGVCSALKHTAITRRLCKQWQETEFLRAHRWATCRWWKTSWPGLRDLSNTRKTVTPSFFYRRNATQGNNLNFDGLTTWYEEHCVATTNREVFIEVASYQV